MSVVIKTHSVLFRHTLYQSGLLKGLSAYMTSFLFVYFNRFPVSNFARDTLAKVEKEPLFNVESLNPNLYSRVPELNRVKVLNEINSVCVCVCVCVMDLLFHIGVTRAAI